MTTKLVTLDQGKDHLRVQTAAEDNDITTKIEQASGLVVDYLKLSGLPAEWDSPANSPPGKNVPQHVQAAVLLCLGELYRNRESSSANVLSDAVKSLLDRTRDPALA